MADNLTDYAERRALDYLVPAGSYLALFTVAPDDAGAGGTEVPTTGGSNYARQQFATSAAATDASSVTTKVNSAAFEFPAAGTAWGTIVAYGVYDAATGGNMVWHRNLAGSEQRSPQPGDAYRVAQGALVFGAS